MKTRKVRVERESKLKDNQINYLKIGEIHEIPKDNLLAMMMANTMINEGILSWVEEEETLARKLALEEFNAKKKENIITNESEKVIQFPVSLRDYFAGQALTSLAELSANQSVDDYSSLQVAGDAYDYADAMIKAGEVKTGGDDGR